MSEELELPYSEFAYQCPKCKYLNDRNESMVSQTEPEFIIPDDGDPHYSWIETHVCVNCSTKYLVRNGT